MPVRAVAPTRLQRHARRGLVAGYLAVILLGFTTAVLPRVFWTMLLPVLPISIVLIGFANWRRVCPLAFFGEIGQKLDRTVQRKVPNWIERWFLITSFSALLAMLVMRLVATNGDGVWLAWTLIALALTALITNAVFTGKSWCNFFCPVGIVERIYTEPRSLPTISNSQCTRCTACKSSCPDIDQENAYWRDLFTGGRRLATYAFPGLVLAFYTYYWLRHGDWEAYFDGRWTTIPVHADLAFGPGFFFAPQLPALWAATSTLVAFSAASYLLFVLFEAGAGFIVKDTERRRHMMLALAAFTAFSIFYAFAGAPTLRKIPAGAPLMAFAAPLIATLFLVKRWGRTRENFIRERGAANLLRNWPFDGPPPTDPGEVYAWVKASEHSRELNVTAYANTVREMIRDGLVRKGELRLLVEVRKQLGITNREHEKVLARLSEEERDLLEHDRTASLEERAQMEGYEDVLADALMRHASEREIAGLRRAFGVAREAHEELLARMRGKSGMMLKRTRDQVERVRKLRRDLEMLATPEPTDAEMFLSHLLLREQDVGINRAIDLLEIMGRAEGVQAVRSGLFACHASARAAAARQLVDICSGAEDLVREMEPWIVDRMPAGSGRDPDAWRKMLERLAASSDLYARAAAVWVACNSDEPWAREIVAGADDGVRSLTGETIERASHGDGSISGARFSELTTLGKMQFLRGVPLFADLDPEDLHEMVSFVEEETLGPSDVLCEEGAVEADDLFILLEGRASVMVRVPDDTGELRTEREVAVLGPREVIGEMSVLDGSPRSATIRPKDGPIDVLRISGLRFRGRLLPRERVARRLLVTLAQRIRDMSRKVVGE